MRRIAEILGSGLLIALAGCARPGEREFAAGLRDLERGRYGAARVAFERSIVRRPAAPENALAHAYIGMACWRLRDAESAARAFQESRRLDRSRWEVAYNLGVIHARGGNEIDAVTLFEEAAMADEAPVAPLEYLGYLHAAAGRWSAARDAWDEAVRRAPKSARLLTRLAVAEFHTTGAAAAEQRLDAALALDPAYPPALFNRFALAARRSGRDAEAAMFARRFLAAAPDHPRREEARSFLEARRADAAAADDWRAAARALAERGAAEEAVRRCLRAAEEARRRGDAPGREQALRFAVELAMDIPLGHAALGRYWLDQRRPELALRSLRQALALGDDSEATLLALAEAGEGAGESDAALETLRRAVRRHPNSADAAWRLAEFLDRAAESSEAAAKEYREFIARFPGDARVIRARERLPALTPRVAPETPPPAAEPASAVLAPSPPPAASAPSPAESAPASRRIPWRRPAARNPAAAAQAYARAAEYYRQGDLDRATFFFIRAVENDDTLADAFLGLGAIYLETGDPELAKDAYRLALERRPDDAMARYNLALALQTLDERSAALAEAALALRGAPDYAPAHYLMGLLLIPDTARRAEARAHFERFLALAPNDPNAPLVRRWLAEAP